MYETGASYNEVNFNNRSHLQGYLLESSSFTSADSLNFQAEDSYSDILQRSMLGSSPRVAAPSYFGPFLPYEDLDLNALYNDRFFQCPGCPRRFGFKSEFKIHYMTHSGEKPFKCSLCPYSTNQNSHLRRHAEKKHGLLATNRENFATPQ